MNKGISVAQRIRLHAARACSIRRSAATYKWAGRAMAMGVLCQVFEVERCQGQIELRAALSAGRREPAGYTGRVFIDEETGMVRRLTIQGAGYPKISACNRPRFRSTTAWCKSAGTIICCRCARCCNCGTPRRLCATRASSAATASSRRSRRSSSRTIKKWKCFVRGRAVC